MTASAVAQYSITAVAMLVLLLGVWLSRSAGRLPHGTRRSQRHATATAACLVSVLLCLVSLAVGQALA